MKNSEYRGIQTFFIVVILLAVFGLGIHGEKLYGQNSPEKGCRWQCDDIHSSVDTWSSYTHRCTCRNGRVYRVQLEITPLQRP